MSSEFLGVGWQFPLTAEATHQIAMASYEECIGNAIQTILSTAHGERVMRPDFGCGIHTMVFAPNSAGTAGQVVGQVRQALVRWEPRIDVLNVTAAPDPGDSTRLLIQIDYSVRATNSRFNLVYPFYLES